MSELTDTIDRLEQWADYWEPHQVPEFIADLRVLINAAKAVSRAVDWLQRAQRHHPENAGEMEACSQGDWIPIDDVRAAIDILQEGQQ